MRKRKNITGRKTYAVVVDGETELWYLQMLKRNEPSLTISIEPKIHVKRPLKEQFEQVKDLANTYDKVFWIIDLDEIMHEERAKSKVSGGFAEFKMYMELLVKDVPDVVKVINAPCLEFWFLLHFKQTGKYFESYAELEKNLKKFLPDYQKSEKFFTRGRDLYSRLKPNLPAALKNSEMTAPFDFMNPNRGVSEFCIFFDALGIA